MIDLGRFIEFWTSYFQHSWAFISILTGTIGTFLTFYQLIKRLRQALAAYLLHRSIKFYRVVQLREWPHLGALLMLTIPAIVLLFLMFLLYVSLIYSIKSSEFLITPEAWTSINYAVGFGIFSSCLLVALAFSSDRMLQRITGLQAPSKTANYFYYCPSCHRYFEVNPDNVILNPTHDLVLGFICPNCRYIAKL